MSRPISERVTDFYWWLEQGAHIVLGGTAAAFTAIGNPIGAGTAAAAWLAFWREWEQRPIESWPDTILDWLFTTIGGLVIGLVVWAVTA